MQRSVRRRNGVINVLSAIVPVRLVPQDSRGGYATKRTNVEEGYQLPNVLGSAASNGSTGDFDRVPLSRPTVQTRNYGNSAECQGVVGQGASEPHPQQKGVAVIGGYFRVVVRLAVQNHGNLAGSWEITRLDADYNRKPSLGPDSTVGGLVPTKVQDVAAVVDVVVLLSVDVLVVFGEDEHLEEREGGQEPLQTLWVTRTRVVRSEN